MKDSGFLRRDSHNTALLILQAAALMLLTLHPLTAEATLVNGGFESDDLIGWTVSIPLGETEFPTTFDPVPPAPWFRPTGTVGVESSGFLAVPTQPPEGEHFLAVGTGNAKFDGATHNITASQTVELKDGDILSGWSSFYNGDYAPQDSAWVKVLDTTGMELDTVWHEVSGLHPISSVDYLSAAPWTRWQWIAPAAGTYVLTLGATTFGDNRFSSYGLHDAIEVANVPETSPTWLFAFTVIGVVLLGRKSTRALQAR